MGNYCYVAVCKVGLSDSASTEGGEGRGHTVAAAHLQLVYFTLVYVALVFVLTVIGALQMSR